MDTPKPRKSPTVDEALAQRLNAPSGAEAYARWLEHMQGTRKRQAAITRNIHTWSNYKNWADKVRSDWRGEEPKG